MNREQIIRAWKDDEYRESLSASDRALVPDHPSGLIELSDAQLGAAGGEEGATLWLKTIGCCSTHYGQGCGTEKLLSYACVCIRNPEA